jgi:hypothetical protein
MTRMKFLTLAILLLGLCPLIVMGQPSLQGALSGTLGPGTYLVVGNCTVDRNATVNIQPGTTFLFTGHFSWKIYGTLHANGTAADSIKFKRQQSTTDCEWSGLRFLTGAATTCNLTHCFIEGARYQVFPDINGGAIYVQNGGVLISYCWITNNLATSGGGIYLDGSAATIQNCVIFGNTAGNGGGLFVYNAQNVNVTNTFFAKNSATST